MTKRVLVSQTLEMNLRRGHTHLLGINFRLITSLLVTSLAEAAKLNWETGRQNDEKEPRQKREPHSGQKQMFP